MKLWLGYRWLKNPYAVLAHRLRQDGLTFWLDLPVLGRTLFTGEPGLLSAIESHPHLGGGNAVAGLREALGEGSLITLDGQPHIERRRLLEPLFASRPDTAMLEDVTRTALEALPLGRPFSAYQFALDVSRRSILRTLFGVLELAEEDEALVSLTAFLRAVSRPEVLFLKPLQRDVGPWRRLRRSRERIHRFILAHQGQGMVGSLASTLSAEDLLAEVLALLMFGHDTGAVTMAWALAHLYSHPEYVHDDAPLLRACLFESMRLCPVVVHLTRTAQQAAHIGGHDIPQGGRVAPCLWLAHHNPELFDHPESFRPQRFLDGRCPGWMPFGFGPRVCVGRPYVLHQMQVVLGTFVRHARATLAPGYRVRPVRQLVLVGPSEGAPLVASHVNRR